MLYVSYLYNKQLKRETIRVYLAAVRALPIAGGWRYPGEECARLKLALKATCTHQSQTQKRPITIDVLKRMGECLTPSTAVLLEGTHGAYFASGTTNIIIEFNPCTSFRLPGEQLGVTSPIRQTVEG